MEGTLHSRFILTQSPSSCKPLKGGGVTVPVFYRGRRALITQDVFEVVFVAKLRYAMNDLADFYIVRHDPDSSSIARMMGLSALVASLFVVPVVGPASNILAGLTAGVFAIGGVINMRRRAPVRWELVATYEGVPRTLFTSENQREFEQVCRGLQRAREHRDDGR